MKRSASAAEQVSRSNGVISLSNEPITSLHLLLENNLRGTQDYRPGIPVVDQTGLTGCFDLKWDYAHDSLEKAVRDNLGLELVPGRARVEFLVVDKVN